jgi:hypothetical protein
MRTYDVVEEVTAEDGTPFRVVIEYDQDTYDLNPRDNDCPAGRIVAISRDSRNSVAPQEDSDDRYSRANAASIVDAIQDHDFQTVARWLRIFHGATTVLPLWDVSTTYGAMELSAGNVTDNPRADRYAGVTFDTPATRKTTGVLPEDMPHALATDVDEYATWARGEVFGWIIQRGELDKDGDVDWEEDLNEDAVWGHIGEDYAREAARIGLDDFIRAYDTDHPDLTGEVDDLRRTELGIPA